MTLTTTPVEIVRRAEMSGAPGLLGRHPSWPRVPVGQLVRVVNGAPFPSRLFNNSGDGLPLVRIRDVGVDKPATFYSGDYDDVHRVTAGDILIGMDGDFRIARWRGPDSLLNQRVCRLDLKSEDIDGRWLLYSLQGYLDAIWQETSSVTVKHLSSKAVTEIPLPLPPMEEQRRIVALLEDHLSRLDVAASELDSALQRTRSAERAALNAFTFGSAPLVPLGHLVQHVEAGKSFGAASRAAGKDEWGIIKVSAMTWGDFRPEENKAVDDVARVDSRYEVKAGDVLVSRANTSSYVGASVLVHETRAKLLLSDKSLRLIPRQGVSRAYLHAVLRSPRARAQISQLATGTKDSMRNISQGALLDVMVPDVDAEEQRRVVQQVDAFSGSLRRLRSQLELAKNRSTVLRRSLLAAAFSGQLATQASQGLESAGV